MVRTVRNELNKSSSPQKTTDVKEKSLQNEVSASMPTESPKASQKVTSLGTSAELNNGLVKAVIEFREEGSDQEERAASHSVQKLNNTLIVEKEGPSQKASHSSKSRTMMDSAVDNDMYFEPFQPSSEREKDLKHSLRSPSPVLYYGNKTTRRERIRNESPEHARGQERERSYDSMRRSPRENPSRIRRTERSRSPRRSPSWNPVYQREVDDFRRFKNYEEQSARRRVRDRSPHDGQDHGRQNFEERVHPRSWNSALTDRRSKHQRSLSLDLSQRRRRSRSSEKCRSPSVPVLPPSNEVVFKLERGQDTLRTADLAVPSSSADRRTRRYKVEAREAERSERKKGGKKPFYLTLSADGIPYGPGKPAWVAEVNKLASGLDPSCTHIRKQTHEDMCILKDRLDDHFEYSGNLNQDHLRGLLGKAVTRKRTELIALIRKNVDRPVTINSEIWRRLENLAKSRQRENRTQLGRYANACRKTMGRTGSIGVARLRQRLAERYGRSPDPEEVGEEMEREKGYGKKDMEALEISRSQIEVYNDDVPEEQSMRHRPQELPVEEYIIDGGQNDRRKVLRTFAFQENITDQLRRGSGRETREGALVESKISSREEYIARLEAELRIFKGDNAKGSSSQTVRRPQSGGGRHEDDGGGLVGYAAGTQTGGSSGHAKMQRFVGSRHKEVDYAED